MFLFVAISIFTNVANFPVGKYLRKNPLARAGFIFYLLSIHLWTFVLLFFHAHGFEVDEHASGGLSPHSLMQQNSPALEKAKAAP